MGNYDYYDYGMPPMDSGLDTEFFSYFMVAYLVIMLLSFVYSVLVYVLQSLGMYTIANRRGIHNPWLAWIPVANVWTLGSISDQYQYVAKGKVRNRRKILLGLNIALIVLMIAFFIVYMVTVFSLIEETMISEPEMMDVIGPLLTILGAFLVLMVVAIIQTVFAYIAYYDLFASCKPDNAVLFLVLGIFFSFLLPYFVFFSRKKDLGMPPRKIQSPELSAVQPTAPAEPEPQLEMPEAAEEPTEE